ncbi:hypothetical protein RvY_01378 [Ramazzottius varieornatus]|uniref:CUB domain-containing protein n=1 Tax=Ramazzottius varieornatus TaxID=947166 RepID=A0A1D1UJN7_RAMVA|nr:hypothetical protein RvY_01378 [Ramazzottius varieornatus]
MSKLACRPFKFNVGNTYLLSLLMTTSVAAALCGGQVWLHDWQAQSIASPNYPGNYPDDIVCEWRIYANYGAQIKINATDFVLENSETCKSDYIQFFWGNGSPSTWKSGGDGDRFCGSEGPFDLVFKDNNLVMKFVTDKSRTNKGFNVSLSIFQICALLYEQPDFYGTPTTLEVFYESDILPSYGASPDTVYQSVEIAEGCKLMVCSDNKFEGTCHLYFRSNRIISPIYANWPRSASCACS